MLVLRKVTFERNWWLSYSLLKVIHSILKLSTWNHDAALLLRKKSLLTASSSQKSLQAGELSFQFIEMTETEPMFSMFADSKCTSNNSAWIWITHFEPIYSQFFSVDLISCSSKSIAAWLSNDTTFPACMFFQFASQLAYQQHPHRHQ